MLNLIDVIFFFGLQLSEVFSQFPAVEKVILTEEDDPYHEDKQHDDVLVFQVWPYGSPDFFHGINVAKKDDSLKLSF